jgi:hypothetical protein
VGQGARKHWTFGRLTGYVDIWPGITPQCRSKVGQRQVGRALFPYFLAEPRGPARRTRTIAAARVSVRYASTTSSERDVFPAQQTEWPPIRPRLVLHFAAVSEELGGNGSELGRTTGRAFAIRTIKVLLRRMMPSVAQWRAGSLPAHFIFEQGVHLNWESATEDVVETSVVNE